LLNTCRSGFPRGGVIVDPRSDIRRDYATGAAVPRARALTQEEGHRGTWDRGDYRDPLLVQKSRLVERIVGIESRRI